MALTKDQVKSYYDKQTYLDNNPDFKAYFIAQQWNDAQIFDHYFDVGLPANRIAIYTYIQRDYAANNTDLNKYALENKWTGQDWLEHYINAGKSEGRVASHVYYKDDYLDLNPDLDQYVTDNPTFDVESHFQNVGRLENRLAIKPGTAMAIADIDNAFAASGGQGQTYILDNFHYKYTGTAGDDLFQAGLSAGGNHTLRNKKIDGLGGQNTVVAVELPAGTITPVLNNIQNVNLNAVADGLVFNAVNSTDLANITFNFSPYNGTVQNIKSLATELGIVDASDATKTYTFRYKAGGIDNDKFGFLNLNNVLGTVTITDSAGTNNPENIVISSNGEINTFTLTDAGTLYKKIVVKGDAPLDVSAATLAGVTYFDASAANGAINAKISTNAPATIKTGKGNDLITRTNLKDTDVIDLGAGDNMLVAPAADVVTASGLITTGNKLGITNVQTLNLTTQLAGNFELAKFDGVKNLLLTGSDTTARTISKVPTGTFVKFNAGTIGLDDTGNLTLGIAEPANTNNELNLVFTTAQDHYLLANSVQTVNVQSDVAGVNIQLNDNAIKTLNVIGAGSADFTAAQHLGNDATIKNTVTSIDASKLVGDFAVAIEPGGVANVTIKGSLTGQNTIVDGSKDDIIYGGNDDDLFATFRGKDTFTGGAGKDEYQIGAGGAGAYDDANTANNKVTIKDFNPGGAGINPVDKLVFDVSGFTQDQILMRGDGTSIVASAFNPLTVTVTGDTAIAGTNNFVFYKFGTFANATALQTQLQTAGT
ncbi:MAG: hypothetical protein ACK4OM_06695, partial [Alphaproteobacteria bacterium]